MNNLGITYQQLKAAHDLMASKGIPLDEIVVTGLTGEKEIFKKNPERN
jgi:hypothetical protein